MATTVREVMTPDPLSVRASETVQDAARMMREADVGPVIVMEDGSVCGIVTDRDIVVRAVAQGKNPAKTKVAEICSQDLNTVTPDDAVEDAVNLMRDKAIRRLPVVEDGKPVGIVSLGDLAEERDPTSALADISSAPPNR